MWISRTQYMVKFVRVVVLSVNAGGVQIVGGYVESGGGSTEVSGSGGHPLKCILRCNPHSIMNEKIGGKLDEQSTV